MIKSAKDFQKSNIRLGN